jgi:hypothetical protein
MQKKKKTITAPGVMPLAYDKCIALSLEKEKAKSQTGFLYLFVALARRASADKDVQDLQHLSGLIEAEIEELQKNKSKLRLRDVFGKK